MLKSYWPLPVVTDNRHVWAVWNDLPSVVFYNVPIVVTYFAEDDYGNINDSFHFSMVVYDNVPPHIECRPASTYNLSAGSNYIVVPSAALVPDPSTYSDLSRNNHYSINKADAGRLAFISIDC